MRHPPAGGWGIGVRRRDGHKSGSPSWACDECTGVLELNAAWGKILQGLTLFLWFAGAVTLIWYALLWVHDYDTLPRSPQPAVARIYPMNMHGIVRYATAKEHHRMHAMEDWLLFFVILGISTGLLHDAVFGRDAWKRRGRP